jgi:rhodanese-related sulfurtransferase
MRNKRLAVSIALLFLLGSISLAVAGAPPKDEKKHTKLAKYATAQEAYQEWKANPGKVTILDIRTEEEYVFVGHPPMAQNIPSKIWAGKWSAEKKDYPLADNPEFVDQVKKKFPTDATLMVMCRSGHRSAAAVNVLAEAGFTNAINIVDGFEGDKISDEESYQNGKRMKNGWRNSGSPWTYDLDPNLVYISSK